MAKRLPDGRYFAVVDYGADAGAAMAGRQLIVGPDGRATLDGVALDGATALWLLAEAWRHHASPMTLPPDVAVRVEIGIHIQATFAAPATPPVSPAP